MVEPLTTDPASGVDDPSDGAAVVFVVVTDPPDGAAVTVVAAAGIAEEVVTGVAGRELAHPAIRTATMTKIIADTHIGENFIDILPVSLKFPATTLLPQVHSSPLQDDLR